MRHPLWLVNTAFLILLVCAAVFTFFSSQKPPKRVSLEPDAGFSQQATSARSIDISKIYENDLFDTYHKSAAPIVEPTFASPLPQAPTQSAPQIAPDTSQPFLPPLDVKIRGIITVDDESHSIAIIADQKTTEQKNYKVGDIVQDAQLVKILPNKAIFIRSNGQQETLYLNEKDLETDPVLFEQREHWLHVVKTAQQGFYLVDPETFEMVTKNLAQFIDMLDITPVHQKGKSIGCRIGNIAPTSLGTALGLEPDDIINSIEGVAVTTTQERYDAYKKVISKDFGQTVVVELTRNNEPLTLTFRLHDLKDPFDQTIDELKKANQLQNIHMIPSEEELNQERIKLLKAKYKFAPTEQDIRVHQKMSMFQQGKREQVKQFKLDK